MGFKYIKPISENQLQASIQSAKDDAYKASVSSAIQNLTAEVIACDTAIVAAYTQADNLITANLAAETSARQTADTNIRNDFQLADTNITASLAAESTARRDGDDSLNAKLGLQSIQLTNLGTSLDTTAAALGNETDNRTEQFKTVGDALNAEINARAAADAAINASLGSIDDRLTADSSISGALANEISTRETQTASLSSAISAEQTARINADDSLSAAVQAEKSARISGDNSLKSIFDTAVVDYKNADSTLKSFVDSSIINLLASDTKILTALNSEVTLRAEQTSSLASALNAEVNLQAGHYTELNNKINAVNTALNTEKTTRQTADGELRASLNAAIDQLNAFYQDFSKRVPIPPESEDSDTKYYLTNRGWGEPIETRIKIGSTPAQVNVPYYSGKVITPLFDNFNPDALSISSETTGTNAGTYTIVFTPNEGYMWANGTQDPRRVTWKILPAVVSVPTADKTSFEYNGGNITLPVSGYDSDCSTQTGTANATAVGNYTAKYELKSTQNYIWSDNTTAPKTIGWKVTVKSIAKPTITNTTFDYDGNNHAPTITGYAADYMTQAGPTSSTNAGNFTVTYSLKDKVNTQWQGGGTGNVTLNWVINRKKLTAAQSTGFAQNGTLIATGGDVGGFGSGQFVNWLNQTVSITNYNSALHKIGGTKTVAGAGTYYATISPGDNYTWSDGTTTAKTVEWKIQPRIIEKPTLDNASYDYDGAKKTPSLSNENFPYTYTQGTTSAKNVGDYTITVALRIAYTGNINATEIKNLKWNDNTTTSLNLNWSIVKGAGIAKPTLSATSFEWTGGNIAPTIKGFNSDTMTKTGAESGTDIKSYSITVSLKDKVNTSWADGTTADVVLNWAITRANLASRGSIVSMGLAKDEGEWIGGLYGYTGDTVYPRYRTSGNSKYITDADLSNYYDFSSQTSAVEAGTYTLKVTPKSTYCWQDGSTGTKTYQWTVGKLSIKKPTVSNTEFTYDGTEHSVKINKQNATTFFDTYVEQAGTASAVNANSYSVIFKLKNPNSTQWADGSTADLTFNWTVAKLSLTAPTLTNATYTYDGNKHSPTVNNFEPAYENQTGQTETATAGTYTVTFSLKDTNNTCWQGGSTDNVTRDWVINKATPTLTLSTNSVTLDNDTPIKTISFTYNGDGEVYASSTTNIHAAVPTIIDNSKIKLTAQHYYNSVITISTREGTNYGKASPVQMTVISQLVNPLNQCNWDEIKAIIADDKATDYWNAGDNTKSFSCTYSGVGTITPHWILLGLDHNYDVEANGKTHYADFMLNMVLTDEKYSLDTTVTTTGYFSMTHTNDYATFHSSDLVSACNKFKNALPTDLKNIIVTPKKYSSRIFTSSGSTWSTYEETVPAIWILDIDEVMGSGEGNVKKYEYFSNGNYINSTTNTWVRTTENNGGMHNNYLYGINYEGYLRNYQHIKGNYSLGFLPCCRIGA